MAYMNKRSEQLNKLLERYYLYVSVGLVGLITILMLNFLIWPQYQVMQSSGVLQYQNIIDVVAQRKAYLQQLQAMQADYESIDRRVVRAIDIALPDAYTEGPVYTEVEQLFNGTQFFLESINVSTGSTTGTTTTTDTVDASASSADAVYQEVTLSINISAIDGTSSYADYLELLRHIEQSPHLMNLESVSYTPGSSAYTLVLKTYQRTPAI